MLNALLEPHVSLPLVSYLPVLSSSPRRPEKLPVRPDWTCCSPLWAWGLLAEWVLHQTTVSTTSLWVRFSFSGKKCGSHYSMFLLAILFFCFYICIFLRTVKRYIYGFYPHAFLLYFSLFLGSAWDMQDLSPLARDWTRAPGSGSMESWPLDFLCHILLKV